MDNIQIHTNENSMTIWLDRQEKHNAITPAMLKELVNIFENITITDTRIIFLRGKGPSFCAGADLNNMKRFATMSDEENRTDARLFARMFNSVYECPVPVIAITHGAVYGGAVGLIAAADFVVSTPDARFSLSETKLGLTPSTIMPYLMTRVAMPALKKIIYTASALSAVEAKQIGLVDEVCTADSIDSHMQLLINQIIANAPGAIAESKRLLHRLEPKVNEQVIEETIRSLALRRKSPEAQEGIHAFFEKRNPNWQHGK